MYMFICVYCFFFRSSEMRSLPEDVRLSLGLILEEASDFWLGTLNIAIPFSPRAGLIFPDFLLFHLDYTFLRLRGT